MSNTAFDPSVGAQPHLPVFPSDIDKGIKQGKYMLLERACVSPSILTAASTVPALPTASQGQIDTIILASAFGNHALEMYQSTAQTLMPAIQDLKGLEVGLDEVDNECVEYVPGGNRSANPLSYVVGTDPGVFIRATFEFTDRSGTDQFIVGFRKQENYAVPTSFLNGGDALYTDFFGVGFSGTSSDLVSTMFDKTNSGSTTAASCGMTHADTEIHQYEVRIAGGVPTVYINGVRLGDTVSKDGTGAAITGRPTTATPAYTFTSALRLIPFIFHRYATTTPGAVYLRRLEVGQLLAVGLQPSGRGPQ